MGKRLTPSAVDAATAKQQPYFLVDSETGLSLRVSPRGAKTFRLRLRSQNLPGEKKSRVIGLGAWSMEPARGFVTLGEARRWCDRFHAALKGGPAEFSKVEAELTALLAPLPVATASPTSPLVKDVAERFLSSLEQRRKRPAEARYVVKHDILPVIGEREILSLKRSDCRALVEGVVSRGAPVHAGKVLGLLRQLLSYAERVDDDFASPATTLRADDLGVQQNVSTRRLESHEVSVLWGALSMSAQWYAEQTYEAPHERVRIALKILLLTAARTAELRLARWEDIDLAEGTWVIPVKNQKLSVRQAKSGKPFVVPLSPTTAALFATLKRETEADGWVLPKFRDRVLEGRERKSPPTLTIDEKTVGKAMRRLWRGHPALNRLEPASPHDLRRTARTWLGKLGVAPHIAERCLNHRPGKVEATYDHHDYLAERRAALNLWDATVQKWVTPPGDGA